MSRGIAAQVAATSPKQSRRSRKRARTKSASSVFQRSSFADPIRLAVRCSDGPRHGLSPGQCGICERYELCVLCHRGRISSRSRRVFAAGFVLAAVKPGGPAENHSLSATRLSMGRAERIARRLIDPTP